MKGVVAQVAGRVCSCCHTKRCEKDGCRVDLKGVPPVRVIVDMDCDALRIPDEQRRCDYLFFGEERDTTCVVPIELKSGRLSASAVLEQIEGGVGMADAWLPQGISFRFVPVLVHGKAIHPRDRRALLAKKVQLRKQKKGVVLIRCGEPLTKALGA